MSAISAEPITLADYDPAWPALFEEERARLEEAIGEWAVAIDHVGSTAVPGLAAKPVIDIGVALRSFSDGLFCITPLVQRGYVCMGEHGIPRRIFFRKPTDSPSPGQTFNGVARTHQIHMYEVTHPEFLAHIDFRDYLRANPNAASDYQDLKRQLAARHGSDVEAYAGAKSDFVSRILALARRPSSHSAKGGSPDKQ